MKFILPYLRSYKGLLAWTLLLATINQVFSLLDPQLFRLIVDKYVNNYTNYTENEFIRWVGLLLLWMVAVAMVSRIAKNFQDYYVNVMTQKIGMKTYQRAIRHAFSLPYSVFEDQQSGQLLQKLLKARQDIEAFIKSLIDVAFLSTVVMLFVIIYASTVHRLIAVLFAALIPIIGVTMYLMSRQIKQAQTMIVKESTLLAGATTESIRNVSLIKSLGLEQQEMNRLEDANTKILWLELKKIKFLRSLEFFQGTLINAMRIVIMAVMFWLVFNELISLGEFFSLFFYSFFVFGPLRSSGQVIKSYQEAKASNDILQDFLQMEPEKLPKNPQTVDAIKTFEFHNVSFAYESSKSVIHKLSMNVKPGETIAFVWPSGAGKSTILKLLVWLYHPQHGKIMINQHDLKTMDPHDYKQRIGIVAQDTQLFSWTIRDNLQFVKPDATDEECMAVLTQASIDSLIRDNKEWLETKIGEGWLKLSWGQRQRLAIARALLRDPEMLIFDEATSSLDSLVEKDITETIKKITAAKPDLITIIVAHRLWTVIHADRIYVLEQGKLVEEGNHKKLLEKKWLYQALRRQQSGGE